ncbi:hypothetical protein AALP_AA6G133100 [Arabis alpina]|uniref:Uncharacterized protein n=1 Tax=Arabis alpina TaxID=50452 RepID=A0A087GNZ3_ARAAL|nr:hypothetical protein AALP_AA6G133100 [Arabis alpina]
MPSNSSASVKLDRRRIRRDPNVTLARASDYRLDTSIPTGVPLAGPSNRHVSDASSPRVELPEHRPHVVPQKVSRDSYGDGSSYVRSEDDSNGSGTSNRVETDEGTSGGEKGSFINFRNAEPKSPGPGLGHGIRLDDSNDVESSMNSSLVYALTPAGGWDAEPVKRKTPKDSIITLLRKDKNYIRHWPDFLSYRIAQSYPRFSTAKKKTTAVQTRPKKSSMVKLNLDVVDSDEEFELPRVDPPIVREGLRPEKAPITHGRGKGLMGGLLAESRRAEEARLERERQKEEAKQKSRDEEKKGVETEARKKKRADEEKEMAKSAKEKKRSAHETLGPGDRVENVARFNTVGLPVEVDHLYAGAVVRVGDGDGSSPSPFDFVFDFRGGRKHISQVPLACLQFVRCVRGGVDFLSPPAVDSSSSDPDTRFAMSAISKNRKLNSQNGDLVAESNRSKEARTRVESEVMKFKDLLSHSQQMNGKLIASRDELSSKVAVLTSALAKAEEAKKDEVSRIEGEVAELRSFSKDAVARAVEEVRKKAKDKLRRSIEIMEGRSRAQTEADRLASLASQMVGAIRRMEKAAKDGVPIDTAKKDKLEARLASYTAEADSIVLPSLPTDSSDDEETEPKKNLALDISSSDSSDEEAERSEVEGRTLVAGKTPALTLAEIEEAANVEAEQVNQLTAELFGDQSEAEGDAGVPGSEDRVAAEETAAIEEPASIETPASVEEPAIDAATGEPIALLFPDLNLEEPETAS